MSSTQLLVMHLLRHSQVSAACHRPFALPSLPCELPCTVDGNHTQLAQKAQRSILLLQLSIVSLPVGTRTLSRSISRHTYKSSEHHVDCSLVQHQGFGAAWGYEVVASVSASTTCPALGALAHFSLTANLLGAASVLKLLRSRHIVHRADRVRDDLGVCSRTHCLQRTSHLAAWNP